MNKNYLRVLLILVMSLTAAPAFAGFSSFSSVEHTYDHFTFTEDPSTIRWEIADAANNRVGVAFHNVQPLPGGAQIFYEVTAANAASYGVDFAAWQAALSVPYTRSILTVGADSHEAPLVRFDSPPEHALVPFQLDHIRVLIDGYEDPQGPTPPRPVFKVGAEDFDPVPEPMTWLFMLSGFFLLMVGSSVCRSR